MRVVASNRRPTSKRQAATVVLPLGAGESEQGPGLRLDALEQCQRSVDEGCDYVVSTLCRVALTAVKEWLEQDDVDPESPVRLAVVRSGFCEGNRSYATRRLRRVLGQSRKFAPRSLRPARFESAFLSLEKAERLTWRRRHDDEEEQQQHTVYVVDDAEAASARSLCELLLGVVSARRQRASVVFIVGARWALPSSLSTAVTSRVVAKEFQLPAFESFADLFFKRLLVSGDMGIVVSQSVFKSWLDALSSVTRTVGDVVRRVSFLLQLHFENAPGAFLAANLDDAADDLHIAAKEADVKERLSSDADDVLLWRQLVRCLAGFASALASSAPSFVSFRGADDDTLFQRTWTAVADWALPSDDLEEDAPEDDSVMKRLLLRDDTVSSATLARVMEDWRDVARSALRARLGDEARRGSAFARLLSAKLVELAHVASVLHKDDDSRALRLEAYELVALCRDHARALQRHVGPQAARLVCFSDAAAAAKPFAGQQWSATVDALNASSKDPRCLAFQIASDHMNVDVQEWYRAYQEVARLGGAGDDQPHDDDDDDDGCHSRRSARFVAALRDLAYTGLVRDVGHKRGRFMICGT